VLPTLQIDGQQQQQLVAVAKSQTTTSKANNFLFWLQSLFSAVVKIKWTNHKYVGCIK